MNPSKVLKKNHLSPLMLEKLLSEGSREPPANLLASPNAFDWDKRLMMYGSSPNAFSLSLNETNGSSSFGANMATSTHLYDYPVQEQPTADLSTIMLMDQMAAVAANVHDSPNHGMNYYGNQLIREDGTPLSTISSVSSIATLNSLLNPLSRRRSCSDRQESHRQSERRRRDSFKSSMSRLESIVVLTISRTGAFDIAGKGPKKKLAFAETYKLAKEIIVALKTEISNIEHQNREFALRLKQ